MNHYPTGLMEVDMALCSPNWLTKPDGKAAIIPLAGMYIWKDMTHIYYKISSAPVSD